jgi:hypothetical protein
MLTNGYDQIFLQLIDLSHLSPPIRTWVLEILENNRTQESHLIQEWKIGSGAFLRSRSNYYHYEKNIFEK